MTINKKPWIKPGLFYVVADCQSREFVAENHAQLFTAEFSVASTTRSSLMAAGWELCRIRV